VWQAGGALSTSSVAGARKLRVPDMTCAIPSDVTVLDKNRDGYADRIYVGDTCGQAWRVDIANPDMNEWTVTKIAAISSGGPGDIANKRKFLFPPDLVFGTDVVGNYTAVLMGTGDREHPFDAIVVNRFYMFKDRDALDANNPQSGALNSTSVKINSWDGTSPTGSPYADSDLFDATSEVLIDPYDTLGHNGWKLTFLPGEKLISSSVTIAGTTFFNTNQPSGVAESEFCGANLGIARQYLVGFADASPPTSQEEPGTETLADRVTRHEGGGYLPSPVPVVVEIDGKRYQAVVSGTRVVSPPGVPLDARTRLYWYKEID
jgi:type IV pilus assembly protein PilY1